MNRAVGERERRNADRGGWEALRALGLNLKHWADDYPVAVSIVASALAIVLLVVVMVLARGCEAPARAGGFNAEGAEKNLGLEKAAMGGRQASMPAEPLGLRHRAWSAGASVRSSRQEASRRQQEVLTGQPPIFSQPLSPSVAQSLSHSSEKAVAPAGNPPFPQDGPGGRSLFDAIRLVESGGDDRAVGDEGRSRGPYQCGRAAWADGGGSPVDYDRLVWDRAACEKVMLGYWRRYGATTDEARARLWNGGPNWRTKPATAEYWRRVSVEIGADARKGEKIMAKRKEKFSAPKELFVTPQHGLAGFCLASKSIGDAYDEAKDAEKLEPDGSAMVGVYRLYRMIRVTRRHDFRPV